MKRLLASILLAGSALASASVARADAAAETRAAHVMDALSGNAAMLRTFLQAMPKGGDLHNHLGGTPAADPACGVALHYLASGFRALPPAQVFRSLILSFALADADPRYVGINLVQPEDWPVALRDYDLHMAMVHFLGARYPRVHRTLHAGELAFGQVPPAAMKNHMRKAIQAGAERIGHGSGIAYEDDAPATLRRMAADHIAVEVNLTSNDVILGVKGGEHPINLYRRFGVPVTLSTDDQGILRTDLTHEYERAVREQGLTYADLKKAARDSLEFGFMPGTGLWRDRRSGEPVAACAAGFGAAACRTLIAGSEKARLEAELEARFDRFEARVDDWNPTPSSPSEGAPGKSE